MNKALFLDRDGVVNIDTVHPYRIEDFEFTPGIFDLCREFRDMGFLIIIITNQAGIAKGLYSTRDFNILTDWMTDEFRKNDIIISKVYFCPHHPEKGFAGERAELKVECECRKPAPGMILKAAKDLNLDLSRSWMIGDSTADLACARAAKVKAVLVRTGNGGMDGKFPVQADHTFDSLPHATRFIVSHPLPITT